MASVLFDRVSKTYSGDDRAVDGIDMLVEDGELLVLVGPSGCGKSTLLRMVAGLEEISVGQIRIGGRIVNQVPPQQRNVAMVFQNYALYPHMTIRRNLEFPLRMRKLPRKEMDRRVRQTANMLNLAELLNRLPKELSGGQRQRVAMGRAIIREADVFLMDEPLSNLDAKLRVKIRTEIATLQSRLGITTLYVTHDQLEALTLGQRVAVMRGGKLQQLASPRELYENPTNIFVAGFIGSPGMNVLRAPLESVEGQLFLRLGDAHLALPDRLRSNYLDLADFTGSELLVGIRPSAFTLADKNTADSFPAIATIAEFLGHETLLHFNAQVTTIATETFQASQVNKTNPILTAVLPGHHTIRPNERLLLKIDVESLRFFDLCGNAL